jgi:hypothetical protein
MKKYSVRKEAECLKRKLMRMKRIRNEEVCGKGQRICRGNGWNK